MASIKIATGLKTYDVEDQNGNIRGQISFNPSDVNFINRLISMEDRLNSYLDEYDNLSDKFVQNESTEVVDIDSKTLEAHRILDEITFYDKKIKQAIDETFDYNVSSVIFGSESAFNMFEGKMFVERFLDSVMPIIKSDIEKANSDIEKHIEKYTAHKFEQ